MSDITSKIETSEYIINYNDDTKTKEAVFKKVLDFFTKYEAFSGEVICQSDEPVIAAPSLLADIADDIMQFKVKWKD